MTEIEHLLDLHEKAYRGDAWHGPSIRKLLDDLSAADAAARPLAGAHTIWEIVLHLAAWQDAVVRRLQGEGIDLSHEQDWPPVGEVNVENWRAALAQLEETHRRLADTIAQLREADLENEVPGKSYPAYVMLHGVVQHNLYHAGQIALLRKVLR